jgi:hypothetical protein
MTFKNLLFTALLALTFTACKDDDDPQTATMEQLNLNLTGLADLGSDYAYEGWIMVDGSPVSTGVFNVDANGVANKISFEIDAVQLEKSTAFILTIEPSPDSDSNPSKIHILAGDFSGTSATLTIDHGAALGNDFTAATGTYILATPTDGMNNNEKSGVWFLDPATGPGPGLDLPTLPDGWKYEGWAVIGGTPVSTGTFTSASGADETALFSGAISGPAYPGEDFVENAPAGLSFPTDLAGTTVVISIEPSPDNSAAPFLLKPLVAPVDAAALDHTPYTMNNNAAATNPTGTATK